MALWHNHQVPWHSRTKQWPLIYSRRKGRVTNTQSLYCFSLFSSCSPTLAIPDGNMSKAVYLGMYLLHTLNNFACRAAGSESLQELIEKRRQLRAAFTKGWGETREKFIGNCIQGLPIFQEFVTFVCSWRTEGRWSARLLAEFACPALHWLSGRCEGRHLSFQGPKKLSHSILPCKKCHSSPTLWHQETITKELLQIKKAWKCWGSMSRSMELSNPPRL